jgi:Calcineurin-like phosphoesterase
LAIPVYSEPSSHRTTYTNHRSPDGLGLRSLLGIGIRYWVLIFQAASPRSGGAVCHYCPTRQAQYKDLMTEGRIIAIGDIHGCSAALAVLIRAIDPTPLDTLVFLGDYIDRGPNSRGVLEQVIALADRCIVVPLLRNHEEILIGALEGQSDLDFWLKFGGMEALASYGNSSGRGIRPGGLRSIIPASHLEFIKDCQGYYETVRHLFVHAFYDPNRPPYTSSAGASCAGHPCRASCN